MQIYKKSHPFFHSKGKSCFKCHKKNIFAEHRKMNCKDVKFKKYAKKSNRKYKSVCRDNAQKTKKRIWSVLYNRNNSQVHGWFIRN